MRNSIAAMLVLACSGTFSIASGATWSAVNSGLPGADLGVNGIVIAPKTPSTIYARASDKTGIGSLFKTADGAASWKVISSLIGVYSFVVDPQNASVIYAQTAQGLLKSSNGGDTWTGAGTGLPDAFSGNVAIDPVTTSTLYVVGGQGAIFKSTDAAATWTALNLGLPQNSFISSLVIDPLVPSNLYFLTSILQPGSPGVSAISKSVDGGGTWNILKTDLPPNANIFNLIPAPAAPSTLFAIVAFPGAVGTSPPEGIFKSTDGGSTWTAVNTGLPSGALIRSLVLDPKDSSVIYLSVVFPFAEAGGILKSTDGGKTWRSSSLGLPANTPIDVLAIDPVTSSTIYIVANGNVLKSADAGAHWNQAAGLTTIDVRALAVNRQDEGTVYAASADSVYKSVDSGATWSNLFAFQITPPATPVFIGSPFPATSPGYPRSLLIDPTNPDVLYAETTRGNGCYFADSLLFKSADGGISWTNSISPATSGCVLGGALGPTSGFKAIDPADPNTIYLAETDDEDEGYSLLKTNDGGSTWKSLGNFPGGLQAGVWTVAIDPSNSATLYAGLDDVSIYEDDGTIQPGTGGAFKSTDGGANWSPIGLAGAAVNLLVIDPSNPSVVYAATEGHYAAPRGFRGLLKSTDGGATWSAINTGLDALLASGSKLTALIIDPADPRVLYAGASGAGVFKSSDAGATWNSLNDGLTNLNVQSMALAPGTRHLLYAGTSNGVFRIFDTP